MATNQKNNNIHEEFRKIIAEYKKELRDIKKEQDTSVLTADIYEQMKDEK
ncbi:MAG: hypothetical protein ACKOW9_01065 [Candidatus Paceibacterota bacterium]